MVDARAQVPTMTAMMAQELLLVQHINCGDACGNTALTFAAQWSDQRLVMSLLQHGALIHLPRSNGLRAFSTALVCGHMGVARLILAVARKRSRHSQAARQLMKQMKVEIEA